MSQTEWQKSTYSGDRDDCVELCRRNDRIAIRESDAPRVIVNASRTQLQALLAHARADARWQKSSFSTDAVECIELAACEPRILTRESDAPRTVISTSPAPARALIARAKAGRLDRERAAR
ncbi:hypothetical protein FHS39_000225 [Streptomyces olivoverticillatus]|uniref:DUF397 domain-containing protein n=1 Tax=Streptomyces olivoverticillatus TaxID=66427 RepID=A0A7W7LJ84_9ACTN|nr:DUF397 domain-containing protein [Streptomyces olivoverticillatus]MBB4891225.1 hypothetical protein [Streptomyces olivoverticillatus]